MIKGLLVFCLAAILLSCSSSQDSASVTGKIKINLIADADINPNEKGESAPLNVFIYNIKDPDVFSNASFFEIVDDTNKPVQSAAAKMYEAILQPGESRTVYFEADDSLRELGVVGAYRNLNDSIWLDVVKVPKKKKSWWRIFNSNAIELNAYVKKTAITIKKMD